MLPGRASNHTSAGLTLISTGSARDQRASKLLAYQVGRCQPCDCVPVSVNPQQMGSPASGTLYDARSSASAIPPMHRRRVVVESHQLGQLGECGEPEQAALLHNRVVE
jgi:hypothetical protein